MKLSIGKNFENIDDKEEIEDIFSNITCKYSLTIFSRNYQSEFPLSLLQLTYIYNK